MNKGERMEEYLRQYFLENGYYVVRGSKLKYDSYDITDIDLFLYRRCSLVSRERINVDIKNKKTPQAFERVLWTKGLQSILKYDKSIVATTDKRNEIRQFALQNEIILIDGNFLADLERNKLINPNRFTEEELYDLITNERFDKLVGNWIDRIEISKSLLLTKMDFSGSNHFLSQIHYFINESLSQPKDYQISLRIAYLMVSYFLITLDFIFKDFSTLSIVKQKAILDEGIRFGQIGFNGVEEMLQQTTEFIDFAFPSSSGMQHELRKKVEVSYKALRADIIAEYFTNLQNDSWFKLACEFENFAFSKRYIDVKELPVEMKSVMYLFLDYFDISRKHFL